MKREKQGCERDCGRRKRSTASPFLRCCTHEEHTDRDKCACVCVARIEKRAPYEAVLTALSPRPRCPGYIHAILEDAQRYASHRTPPGNPVSITKEDVRLATQARVEFTKAAPPPREVRANGVRVCVWQARARARARSTVSPWCSTARISDSGAVHYARRAADVRAPALWPRLTTCPPAPHTQHPQFLLDIARERNAQPLQAPSESATGLYLPPARYALTNPNYAVKVPKVRLPAGRRPPVAL